MDLFLVALNEISLEGLDGEYFTRCVFFRYFFHNKRQALKFNFFFCVHPLKLGLAILRF